MPTRLITPSQLSLFSITPVIGAWWEELQAQNQRGSGGLERHHPCLCPGLISWPHQPTAGSAPATARPCSGPTSCIGRSAGDMVLDARRDPAMWSKFNAGLEGSAWYLLRMHQELLDRLPESRSVELLGEAVNDILHSNAYQQLIPAGSTTESWANSYPQRHGSPLR